MNRLGEIVRALVFGALIGVIAYTLIDTSVKTAIGFGAVFALLSLAV